MIPNLLNENRSRWRVVIVYDRASYVYDRWEPEQAHANISALSQFYEEHPEYAVWPVQVESKAVHQ